MSLFEYSLFRLTSAALHGHGYEATRWQPTSRHILTTRWSIGNLPADSSLQENDSSSPHSQLMAPQAEVGPRQHLSYPC